MSKTRAGNIWGAFFLLLGIGIIAVWYLHSSTNAVLFVGVGLAIFGAGIINPQVVKEGAAEFKENAGDLIPLGRRSTDGTAVKVPPKKEEGP